MAMVEIRMKKWLLRLKIDDEMLIDTTEALDRNHALWRGNER